MVYFKNEEEYLNIEIYNLDTDQNILNRLAAKLKTLKNYLYFPDGEPNTEQILLANTEETAIEVKNILSIIQNTESFADLYEELLPIMAKMKITLDSVVELFVIYNKNILEYSAFDKTMFETILFSESQNIKDVTGKNFNIIDIFSRKDTINRNINDNIKNNITRSLIIEKIYYQLDNVPEIPYTKFVTEKINFSITIDTNISSIMEIFNNIILDHNAPFATKNEYYKILKDFVPPVEWAEYKTEDDIILKVNQKKEMDDTIFYLDEGISSDKRLKILEEDFTNVLVSFDKQKNHIVIEVEDFTLERYNVNKNELIERILKVLNTSRNIIEDKDTSVKGVFYFPNHKLNKYVFSDLIMNSYLFSSVMSVDESFKATKTGSSFYIHFSNKKIGNLTANVNEKIMDKKYLKQEIINKNIDPTLFFMNQEFIRVKITRAIDIQNVEEFQKIFSKLLTLYDRKFSEIYEYYNQYTDISEPERILEEQRKVKSLKDIVPELFLPKYSRICRKPPTVIENDEDNPRNLDVMIFPKSDTEGTIQRKYICNYDKNPYPGIRENPHDNSDRFPFVPCCYRKPQTKNAKFLEYFENIEPVQTAYKKDKKSNIYSTNRFATYNDFGYLPKDIAKIFYVADKNKIYYRKGVFRNKNSFLNCVLEALNVNDILKIDDEEERNNILLQTRNELAIPSFAAACRQELYDYSVEQIIEKIKDPEVYLDPKLFINLLQVKYNCNIFLFTRKSRYGEMIVPRHLKHYFKHKNNNTCIFIYEHEGTESDRAVYPQCELIVASNDEGETQFDFPYDTPVSQNIIDLFNELRSSYSLNKMITDTEINLKELEIVSQFIDSFGKTRILNILFEDKEISLITDPMQPINVPEIPNLFINKTDVDVSLKLAAYLEIALYKQITSNLVTKQFSGIVNNINISIPVNDARIVNGIPEFESTLEYIDSEFSILENYNFYKKLSRYIVEYLFWLFSKYLNENEIYTLTYSEEEPFGNVDINQFIDQYITIQPDFVYKNISKTFSLDSNVMSGNKLVVKDENTLKKVLYYLKLEVVRNNKQLVDYHMRTSIKNFYLDISDLDVYNFQIILKGENSITKWIDDTTYKKDVIQDDVMLENKQPYFFKNTLISKSIVLAQNSNTLRDAIFVSLKWHNDRYNPKNEFNDVKDIPDFLLYTYNSKYEISKYYVDNKLKNNYDIRILGYQVEDKNVFTSLLKL